VSRAGARRRGLSDDQVTRRARHRWVRVRRGQFLVPRDGVRLDPVTVELVAAGGRRPRGRRGARARRSAVAAALSAAGLGAAGPAHPGRPHRARNGVRVVVTPLPDDDVVQHPSGLLVTSAVRTVTDCLRVLRPPDAMAVVDAAARRLVPAGVLVAAVDRLKGWRGVVRARRLAALADGRRESALESWSALAFDDLGVPAPQWQADVSDAWGFVGRGDAWWRCGVVGEPDGKARYRLRAAELGGLDAERLAQVLDDERGRERRLRAAGLTVVRWGAKDVLSPAAADALAAYLRRELRGRRGRTFDASVVPHPFDEPTWSSPG